MMLTKEKCKNALNNILCNIGVARSDYRKSGKAKEDYHTLNSLIEEHFSNPPLSLNEVRQFWHEGIPVWDTELEEYVQIHDVIGNEENGLVSVEQFFFESISVYQYHSKRFYRKEVQE